MTPAARGSTILERSAIIATCFLWTLTCSAATQGMSDAQIANSQQRTDRVIAALVERSDADSLAAAGLLSLFKHGDQTLSLLARAAAAAPERPDLVWLQAQRCSRSPPCDPEPIEQRLRELDSANGAGWWGALARANAANDTAGVDAALAAMSHAGRVDIYWTTLVARLSAAVAATKKMSLSESEVAVIGAIAAEAIPAYQALTAPCNVERRQQAEVLEVCRGVAKALQNGDTYTTEMVGVAIAKHLWPEASPEWKAAAEERRVYDYRAKVYPRVEFHSLMHAKEYLAFCAQNRREQDVLLAQLIAVGETPNPPPR